MEAIQLQVLSYDLLHARNKKEVPKLLSSASEIGMFFLDLGGEETGILIDNLPPIIDAQRRFFTRNEGAELSSSSDLLARGYGLLFYTLDESII